jgi:hypothetical protein
MINSIMIFFDNGTLFYDAIFEKTNIQGELVAGFVGALSQFGLKIFPGEELEDIVFTRHHICLTKHVIGDKEIIIMFVHDPKMNHVDIKKITTQLFMELKGKYASTLKQDLFDRSKIFNLDAFLEKLLINERRPEKMLPRTRF